MVRVLRTIGFDRDWARTEGAYLYDAEGERYLDWLGGFGMFNVGRNNPRVRDWLAEAMELQTPNAPQMGVSPVTPLLAEELVRRAPASIGKALFTNSGTESVEAAIKLGRAATGRERVVCVEHAFHGLTLGSLSINGEAAFTDRFGPYLPGVARVPFDDLDALEARAATRGRRAVRRRADPRQGRDPPVRRLPRRARRSSAAATGRSSAWTRCRRASAAPAGSSPPSTGGSSRT